MTTQSIASNLANKFLNLFDKYDEFQFETKNKIHDFLNEFHRESNSEKINITNSIYDLAITELKSDRADCNLTAVLLKFEFYNNSTRFKKNKDGLIGDIRPFVYYYLSKYNLQDAVEHIWNPREIDSILKSISRQQKAVKYGVVTQIKNSHHTVPVYIEFDGISNWKILMSDVAWQVNKEETIFLEECICYFFSFRKNFSATIYRSNLIRQASNTDCPIFSVKDLKYFFKEQELFTKIGNNNPKLVKTLTNVNVFEIDFLPIKCLKMAQISKEIKRYLSLFPQQGQEKVDRDGSTLQEYIIKWKRTRLIHSLHDKTTIKINIRAQLVYLKFEKKLIAFLGQPDSSKLIWDRKFPDINKNLGTKILEFTNNFSSKNS